MGVMTPALLLPLSQAGLFEFHSLHAPGSRNPEGEVMLQLRFLGSPFQTLLPLLPAFVCRFDFGALLFV